MKEGDELVVVVIPTRNRGDSVARAARSVLAQTHRALELVVVDDGSAVPVALPADVAADPRVRVIRTDGVGAGAARNLGVAASEAQLVAFLDDDDAWRPEKLARELAALRAAPAGTAAVESGFDLWEHGRLVMRYLPDPARDLYRTLLERPALQPSTVLLRRDVFDELGGFASHLERTEDWHLWVRLAETHRVAALPEVHVDREHNAELDASVALRCYAETVELYAPRIAQLPRRDRRRIDSEHAFIKGVLAAQAGDRRRARRHLLESWRTDPRRLRPLAHLVRASAGERAWRIVRRAALAGRAAWLTATRRDPAVRRW